MDVPHIPLHQEIYLEMKILHLIDAITSLHELQ